MRNFERVFLALLLLNGAAFGQTLVNRLVLSGDGNDRPAVISTDSNGFVYVAGTTTSGNFPVTDALQARPPQAALQVSVNGAAFVNASLTASQIGAVAASSDGALVLASTPTGIARSTNQGATWTAPVTGLPLCAALAVDPVNPSIAYALVQNAYALQNTDFLYKSTDGGVHWQSTGASFPYSSQVSQIAVDSQTDTTLYLWAGNGVYVSTDGGTSWQELPNPNATSPVGIAALALAPSQPNVLYASEASIYRSTDGGSTWTAGASNVFATTPNAMAVDPTAASTVWVADNNVSVWKSTDGGVTFQTMTTLDTNYPNSNPVVSVAIDPANPSHVYVSTTYNTYETGDGGQTWTRVGSAAWALYAAPSRIYTSGGSVPRTVFLAKLDAALAQVIYSTYLWAGAVSAIAVDSAGDVYLAGSVATGNGVVMKIAASDNAVLYSTPFAGAVPNAIAIDSGGNAVIAGAATALPVTKAAYQSAIPGPCTLPINPTDAFFTQENTHAFVAKLNPSGALVDATYLTGSCGDSAFAVALDSSGDIYLGGQTYSPDFPVTANAMIPNFPATYSSGFVAKMSSTGSQLLYSSFIGGGSLNSVQVVSLDGENVFLAGSTQALATTGDSHALSPAGCPQGGPGPGPSPTEPPPGNNPFVMEMTLSSSPPIFLATVGGTCQGAADSLAIDAAGNIWLAGSNGSWNFPPVAPIGGLADIPPNYLYYIGSATGFLAELNPSGAALLSSTVTDSFGAVAADSAAVYYTGGLGDLNSSGVPSGNYGAVVAEINPTNTAQIFIDEITQLNSTSPSPVAPGEIVHIVGRGIGPQTTAGAKLTASGTMSTSIGGVEVTFNGVPAPLVTAQANLIEAIAPFELNGLTSANIQVQYNGQVSNTYTVSVILQNPDIVAVVNSDWTVNSPTNPAKPGSMVAIFLTGLGQTNPPGVDGAINVAPLAQPAVPPQITFSGNYSGAVTFLGAAANEVSGVSQINVNIGSTLLAPPNLQAYVECEITGTIAVEFLIYVAP
jgi:uncharacterized protein (TIGR03437 family)